MKSIFLSRGLMALVDDSDFVFLSKWKWCANRSRKKFYALRRDSKSGKLVYMHREIVHPPKRMQIDHRDGNGLNNQRSNLRLAFQFQNQGNSGVRSHNKCGFKGVRKSYGKWEVQITRNGKPYRIGRFYDIVDAAMAYDMEAKKYFGDFALTNRKLGLL